MKIVIVGVLAFVLGVGGSIGVILLQAKPAAAAAAATSAAAADSGGKAPVAKDSATHAGTHPAGGARAADSAHPAARGGTGSPGVRRIDPAHPPVPVAARPLVPPHPTPGAPAQADGAAEHRPAAAPSAVVPVSPEQVLAYKQVGKILSNMKPAEAAKVIGGLSDDDVEGIVRQLGARQAAVLLAALPPQRAGVMSRRLLDVNAAHEVTH